MKVNTLGNQHKNLLVDYLSLPIIKGRQIPTNY